MTKSHAIQVLFRHKRTVLRSLQAALVWIFIAPLTVQAATVNLSISGAVSSVPTASFTSALSLMVGDTYELSLNVDTETTLSHSSGSSIASYQQAIVGASLSIGGLDYALAAIPFTFGRANLVGFYNDQAVAQDGVSFSVPLIGPSQGGMSMSHAVFSFTYGDDALLSGVGLEQLLTFASSNPSDWGLKTVQFRYRNGVSGTTGIVGGTVQNISGEISAVPLPQAGGLLIASLFALRRLKHRPQKTETYA